MPSSSAPPQLLPMRKCNRCNQKDGIFTCSRCKDTTPTRAYCSQHCQKVDWSLHKKFCGKIAYTFDLTLAGSTNPVIKRTFDVPSWFTFRHLHYTIQYVMGPWMNIHLHNFTFFRPDSSPLTKQRFGFGPNPVLSVTNQHEMNFSMIDSSSKPSEYEESLKLSDVYGEGGRLNNLVRDDSQPGKVLPLCYLYDFGDNWEHILEFKGQKLAAESRPVFSSAKGCAPVEDSGSTRGWNQVKSAFRTLKPTKDQEEMREWARNHSGRGESYNPFEEPDVVQMNYGGRWENHMRDYMRMSGDTGKMPI